MSADKYPSIFSCQMKAIVAGPKEARNPNLDSDQRIVRHVFNRDTETGS